MKNPSRPPRSARLPAFALLAVLTAGAAAQSLDQKVQTLIDQNAKQQQEINNLRTQLAASQGQSGADMAAAETHDHILDLKVVDASVAKQLEERGITPGSVPAPGWLNGLVFKGDMRLRYEGLYYEDDDAFPQDRNRGRFRLRFGFDKTWGSDKEWSTGFRLASGGNAEPSSTNQTFTDWFNKKPLWIDQAWVRWASENQYLKGLEVIGGKMKQPFLTTFQEWDTDVNPEGVFEKYTAPFFGDFKPYANFAQFFLQENAARPADASLLVYGGGFDWLLDNTSKTTFSTAVNYYDYTHIHDNNPPGLNGNPQVTLPSGRKFLKAEDFDILDWVTNVKGTAFDIDYLFYLDFGWNTGVDEDQNDPEFDETFAVGLLLGKNKKKGDMSLEGAYVRNEPNSVLGYFADSDLGFANKRAGVIRYFYSLTDFANVGGSLYMTDLGFETDEDKDHQELLQIDLNIKF